MFRLVSRLILLLLLFAGAMALTATGVFSSWWYGVIGGGVFVLFVVAGGLLVPSARSRLRGRDAKTGAALVQTLGAWCLLLFSIMAMVTWAYGNRYMFNNNYYGALGVLVFLLFIGVAIPGAIFTLARVGFVHNQAVIQERRQRAASAQPA